MLKYQSFTYQHFKKVSYQNDLLQTRDLSTPNVYDLFFLLRRIELFIYTSFISTVICTGRFPYIYRYCYFTVVHLTVEKKLRALIIGSDSSAVDTTIIQLLWFRDKTKPSKQKAPNAPMLCQQNATNVILKWSLNSDLATRKTSSAKYHTNDTND